MSEDQEAVRGRDGLLRHPLWSFSSNIFQDRFYCNRCYWCLWGWVLCYWYLRRCGPELRTFRPSRLIACSNWVLVILRRNVQAGSFLLSFPFFFLTTSTFWVGVPKCWTVQTISARAIQSTTRQKHRRQWIRYRVWTRWFFGQVELACTETGTLGLGPGAGT